MSARIPKHAWDSDVTRYGRTGVSNFVFSIIGLIQGFGAQLQLWLLAIYHNVPILHHKSSTTLISISNIIISFHSSLYNSTLVRQEKE